MAFQLTRLNVPSLTTDFSAETNAAAGLAKAVGGLPAEWRKQQEAATQKQILGSLGEDIKRGDYQSAASKAFALGDIQAGATISTLGQKAQEQKREADWVKNNAGLFGGAATGGGSAPVVPGTASLIQNESGGNWRAQNDATGAGGAKGHFGRAQFGQARLQEAAAAGAIPPGTTPQQFMASPELQQRAEQWHFSDIDQAIKQNGYDQLVGKAAIGGVPVTVEGLRAVAHLGGKEGMRKFVETQGRYNPADANGTRLSDYFARHGAQGGAAPQVAQAPARGVAPIPGDDPIKLRQEAEAYRQSNPEAARQMLARADAAERGAGVQTAQAPGGDPRADQTPGTGAPTQFVIPGTTPQQTRAISSDPQVRSFLRALDGAPERFKAGIKQRLDLRIEELKQARSEQGVDGQLKQEQLTKARRENAGEEPLALTPEERQKFGIAPDQAAYRTRDGIKFGPAGTKIINEAQKLQGAEDKARVDINTKFIGKLADSGPQVAQRMADMDVLAAVVRDAPPGPTADVQVFFDRLGAGLGLSTGELATRSDAMKAIIQRLAPAQREEGSGSTSDIEFKGMLASFPSLATTAEGRQMILTTIARQNEITRMRIEVADQWTQGEIPATEARKKIAAIDKASIYASEDEKKLIRQLAGTAKGGDLGKDSGAMRREVGGKLYEQRGGQWYPVERK